ncbi:MAG TPA: TIGR03118 family protein, partial [Tepidisphaeraceae bacterium]
AITLPASAFSDPNLPKGYAPFNIQLLGNKILVTYAKQDKARHDDDAGPGRGFVDVFNLDGTPGLTNGNMRLASRGALDSPWGLAIAPSTFGSLAGDLLVGNFGDGTINAFDPATGASLGQLTDPDGEPIQIDGLWALKVGNGGSGGSSNDVYFTAGLFSETHGLFGSLTSVAPGTPEGPAETQMAQASLDVAQLNLATLQADLAANASKDQIRQDAQALAQSVVDLIHVDHSLDRDNLTDGGSSSTESPVDTAIDTFLDNLRNLDLKHKHKGDFDLDFDWGS